MFYIVKHFCCGVFEMKKACCFGHREIFKYAESADEIQAFKECLSGVIDKQITQQNVGVFYTGAHGEFDIVFSAEVRKLKEKYPFIKLILVEPYFSNRFNRLKSYYETMYDSIIIPDELADVHYKKSIEMRNRWMVDNSELVISYVDRRSGGAYKAIKYAESRNTLVINLGAVNMSI